MLWRKRSDRPSAKPGGDTKGSVPPPGFGGGSPEHIESDRTLAACADILAWCGTAISEISDAAAPFLTVQERASLRAQGTNFQSLGYQSSAIIEQPSAAVAPAPAMTEAVSAAVATDQLSREEVEAIVGHRVEIAVKETLASLGVAPGSSIRDEVERQVEIQLATQEHRLLEYVKRHLTDSLKVLETSLSERLGEVLEGKSELAEAKAEVDAQVEGAREALLRQIEEVRTVNVGFNIDSYAAELAGVANVEIDEEEELILDGEEIEIDLGAMDEEISIGEAPPATPDPKEVARLAAAEKAAAKKRAADEKAAAKERAAAEKAAAKKRAADEKAAAKERAAAEKAAAKERAAAEKAAAEKAAAEKAAAEKAAAEKAAAEKAAAEKAAAEKAAAEKAAAEKAAAEKAAAEKAAAEKAVVAEVVAEEDDLQISLMPAPGQDIAEIYLNDRTAEVEDGDPRESGGISLDLDEESERGSGSTSVNEIAAAVEHYTREGDQAMGKNRFSGAVISYNSAIKVAPDRGDLYLKRGLAYRADGENKKAFLDLMKARDLDSDLPDIRKHLTETRKALSEASAADKGSKTS